MKKFGGLGFLFMSSNCVSRDSHPIPAPPLGRGDDDDQEVDTTLRLGLPGTTTTTNDKSTTTKGAVDDDGREFKINVLPLRWYCPPEAHFYGFDHNQLTDTSVCTSNPLLGNYNNNVKKSREKKRGKKRKMIRDDNGGGEKTHQRKRRAKSNGGGDDSNQRPSLPFEEIPLLQQTLISRQGSRPVFLYRKKLEMSDVLKDQNRLLVNEREKLMEFLREEEVAAVVGGGKGLKVVGIDGVGKVYETVGVKEWLSLGKIAINSDWSQLVAANTAEKGDVVEIWGYREKERACLAFNFRRESEMEEEEERGLTASGSTTTTIV